MLAAALSRPAAAQEAYQGELPKRQQQRATVVQSAATLAHTQADVLDADVTYADILADPDNLTLNFQYARAQVARGDLTGASATLERMLLIDPSLADVRLFHGLVLLRLGSVEEAYRALVSVTEQPLTPDLRRQAHEGLRQLRLRRKLTRWTARSSLGWQYDRNRNAAPGDFRLFADTALGLEGASRRRHDTSFLSIHSLEVAHDLGAQAGHQLTGSFTHYVGEQTQADDLDLASFSFTGGGVIKTPWGELAPELTVDHVSLSRETYLRAQGGRLALRRQCTPALSGAIETTIAREEFNGITENSAATERAGTRATLTGSTRYLLTPSMQLSASIAYDHKEAKADYYAYDGFSVQGSHAWILPGGQFILNTLALESDDYDQPDTALVARTRRDHQLRYQLTYGLPLSLVLGRSPVPAWVHEGLSTAATFEQSRSDSTVTNYSYTNSKFQLLVTKVVEF